MMMMENNVNGDDHHLLSSDFQVIFFDGEREHDKGYVHITPSLTFKEFQSILREKLETSPHQITIYFERHNNNHNHNQNLAQHHRRRHPVTSKFDFGSIIPEFNTSFFWVVQKRSRRTRRRKPKNFNFNYPMENFALLRRNQLHQNHQQNSINDYSSVNNVSDFEYMEYVNRMRLRLDRERYLMSMDLNSNVYDDLSCFFGGQYGNFSDDGASSSGGGSSIDYTINNTNTNTNRGFGFCDVCYYNAVRGETTPFHCCKNDAVTQIFRSPAGPIGPPKKAHILG